jgi:hypothetical protein
MYHEVTIAEGRTAGVLYRFTAPATRCDTQSQAFWRGELDAVVARGGYALIHVLQRMQREGITVYEYWGEGEDETNRVHTAHRSQ